jgi:hypothetical protein
MDWHQAKQVNEAVQIPDRWLHLHYYEALNILFRFENALRVFVYVILKRVKSREHPLLCCSAMRYKFVRLFEKRLWTF